MKSIWSWPSKGSHPKFSRDDEQIFALNYDNLCDADYLLRLFLQEEVAEPEATPSHTWMITADLPEDILLFSASNKLGIELMTKRAHHDDNSISRCLDSHTELVIGQIRVFDYIRRLVVQRCRSERPRTSLANNDATDKNFLSSTVVCALRVFEKSSRQRIKQESLVSLVSLVTSSLSNKGVLPIVHARRIRRILNMAFRQGTASTDINDSADALQLALTSAYGLLRIGLGSGSRGDVLFALLYFIAINVSIDEKNTLLADNNVPMLETEICEKIRHMKVKLSDKVPIKYSSIVPPQAEDDLPLRCDDTYEIKLTSKWDKSKDGRKLPVSKSKPQIELEDGSISSSLPWRASTDNRSKPSTKPNTAEDGNKKLKSRFDHLLRVPDDISGEIRRIGVVSETSLMSIVESEVWTCGQNSYGELGHGDVSLRKSYARVSFFEGKNITSLGAGNEHSVFVSQQGRTYVAGYNDNGQCGTGNTTQVRQPMLIPTLEGEDISEVHVYNGCEHTMLLSRDGKLYTFGYNYRGQLGLGNTSSEQLPRPVKSLFARKVVLAACSYHHSIVVCADGAVLSFGRNDCGQLGHGDTIDKKTPHIVSGIQKTVVSVSCGQFHTSLITTNGVAMTCGKNDYGQLGHESADNIRTFTKVGGQAENASMIQVCCGYYHSLFLSQSGQVYVCGRNDYGQLGLGHAIPRIFGLHVVNHLRDKNVISVHAGCYHSIAVTPNGMLYVFGRNNHGQLGTGDADERHFPHPVDDFVGKKIIQIAAGFYHTVVLVTSSHHDDDEKSMIGTTIMDVKLSESGTVVLKKSQPIDHRLKLAGENNPSEQDVSEQNTVRDLVLGLTKWLENNTSVLQGDSFQFTEEKLLTESSKATLTWISTQLRALGMLISLCRQHVSGILGVELPFTLEESCQILSMASKCADCILYSLGQEIRRVGITSLLELPDNENFSDSLLSHANHLATPHSIVQDIVEIESESEFSADIDVYISLTEAIQSVRKELLCLYFFLPESIDPASALVSRTLKSLVHTFDGLFWCLPSKSHFFAFLSDSLMDHPIDDFDAVYSSFTSVDFDTLDYVRALKLFTRLFFKYRDSSEIVTLFQDDTHHSLNIFHRLLLVFVFLSRRKLSSTVKKSSYYNIHRILNMLEYCVSNFIKVALPVMLMTAEDPSSSDFLLELNRAIIETLFAGAENVLDFLLSHPISDDTLESLRNGTVLTSILPTFFLYVLSNQQVNAFNIQESLFVFLIKMQKVHVLIENESKAKKALKKEEEKKPQAETKKELLPWWTRLLKLSVMLSSHMSTIAPVEQQAIDLSRHDVWRYLYLMKQPEIHLIIPPIENFSPRPVEYMQDPFREVVLSKNNTYRTVLRAAKAGGTLSILEGIEQAVCQCIVHVLGLPYNNHMVDMRYIMIPGWTAIATITLDIVSRRSELLGKSSLSWREILKLLQHIALYTKNFFLQCPSRYVSAPVMSGRKVHRIFRRVLMIVSIVCRWKACVKNRVSKQGIAVVQAFNSILRHCVLDCSVIAHDVAQSRWKETIQSFVTCNDGMILTNNNISTSNSLFKTTQHASTKLDIIAMLSLSWQQIVSQSVPLAPLAICHQEDVYMSYSFTMKSLIRVVEKAIHEFHVAVADKNNLIPLHDLNLFCLYVRFLQYVIFEQIGTDFAVKPVFLLSELRAILIILDDRLAELQLTDDKGSAGGAAVRRAQVRERSLFLRRAVTVTISLIQCISIRTIEHSSAASPYFVEYLIDAHTVLLSYLFKSRTTITQYDEGKDLRNNKESANAHRRRCQELIVQPMQFNRSQEGFVVQGEKLLSNFKGVDFTLAFWVFVSNKSSPKYSFIAGKISHNDAWPLVLLRGADNKLEIVYGKASEFERFSSLSSVPLCTWVHIGVVIEPRKIRLYINGTLDNQVNNPGNVRAILYPVVIGSCPANVRTRVEHIREGFDGLLTSFKYYTRALSPIHVRVIYDQGPPEAHDSRERWSYQLLASCKTLVYSIESYALSPPLCQKLLGVMHALYLSDSSRIRFGALKVIERLLLLDIASDMPLYPHAGSESSQKGVESILHVEFLSEYSTFRERVLLYYIRVMGMCWTPGYLRQAAVSIKKDGNQDISQSNQRLHDFLFYCPTFVGLGGNHDQTAGNDNNSIEVPVPREDLVYELCQVVRLMIRRVSEHPQWNAALSSVLYKCLCKSKNIIDTRTEWTQLALVDALGAAVFLGGSPAKPCIGMEVESFYCNASATVLSIDKTTNNTTILTSSDSNINQRIVTLRLNDLTGFNSTIDDVHLTNSTVGVVYDILEVLQPYISLVMSDVLSIYRPDHAYLRQSLLRSSRPLEIFLYNELSRWVAHASVVSMSELRQRNQLFYSMLRNSMRVIISGQQAKEDSQQASDRFIPCLWMKCPQYLACMADKPILVEVSAEAERNYQDYITKHLGIVSDSFPGPQQALYKRGYLPEIIQVASYCGADMSALHVSTEMVPVTDMKTRGLEDISEQEIAFALRLLYQMRKAIVLHCRSVLCSAKMKLDTFVSMQLPWAVAYWQVLVYENSMQQPPILTNMIESFGNLLQERQWQKVTDSLLFSLRYSSLAFYHTIKGVGSSNAIESTDLFCRTSHAIMSWIRSHEQRDNEPNLCLQVLQVLLPALTRIESAELELSVLQICQYAQERLLSCIMHGWCPTQEVIDMAKMISFSSLWSRAQDNLIKERGQVQYHASALTQGLVKLASGFAIIQRYSPSTSQAATTTKEMLPPAPVVLKARSTNVEIELELPLDAHSAMVELALQVASDEIGVFETIYYGNASSIVHSGLTPGTEYSVRCRWIVDSIATTWSTNTTFCTESTGLPFIFDPFKCGADIVLSNDGITASYTGDDNWSTVLGTTPFTTGLNFWEVRITCSSTAYIFVGVATSASDLNTFLGGCPEGWGFIGEQALYHGREKVKIYGEPFSAGDVVGVALDYDSGTLSFTRNGNNLGVAFDKIYGELFPAVAFYNAGQEVEIVVNRCRISCPAAPLPCLPSAINLDQFSMLSEIMYCRNMRLPFSSRLLHKLVEHIRLWTSGIVIRRRAVSGSQIFISKRSPLLETFGLRVGDRVRTQYGVADIIGCAYDRIWFETKENSGVWFFSKNQILDGRQNGLFVNCTYKENNTLIQESPEQLNFDVTTLQELLDPGRWTEAIDATLISFLQQQGVAGNVSPWDVTAEVVCNEYRSLHQQISRYVMNSADLSHKWGISGPKRKAVIARMGMLRLLNHLLEHNLPIIVPHSLLTAPSLARKHDEFLPTLVTLQSNSETVVQKPLVLKNNEEGYVSWPVIVCSWSHHAFNTNVHSHMSITSARTCVFTDFKMKHFWRIVSTSATRVAKTDDDYDYPEDLPQVKLNRFKSFRAFEIAEKHGITGDDLLFSSMFCQLWKELRQHSSDKLRISYTHPMDDGQSRTFKVKFEGEGVDDYGGPYREIFQKLCVELQTPDPLFDETRCFLPVLHPTPNWKSNVECAEKYKYTFLPSSSPLKLDLYTFLGQLVGIALRSKITLDLSLSSFIWKSVVRQKLSEHDIASFDAAASQFIHHLGSLYERLHQNMDSLEAMASLREEAEAIIMDLTWTATLCDGQVVELIPGGEHITVTVEDLGQYLDMYVKCRLNECFDAIEAFRNGILSVIPLSAIQIFSWEELEALVCGTKQIDVERLKANTEYDDDVSPDDPHIVAFWEVLASFTEEEKSAFLRFVWARPTLPPKDVDFPQKLKIQSAVGDDASLQPDQYLPKAHTCFFSINLPRYSTKELMAEKLRYAIVHCTEMDADYRVTEPDVAGWSSTPVAQVWSVNAE